MSSRIIDQIADSRIRQFPNDSAFFYRAGFAVNADGGRHCYHPDKGKGLDYLENAGSPLNWWGIACDANGNPYLQDNGYYISTTSLVDGRKRENDPDRYVDSETVPFIVLPAGKHYSAKLGDYAYIYNTNKGLGAGAIFADGGPPDKIGEGSIALAQLLQINHDPKKGGCGDGVIWVVFPQSRDTDIFPIDLNKIQAKATKLFKSWGGLTRLAYEYPGLKFSGMTVRQPMASDVSNIPMQLEIPKQDTPIGVLKISTKTWIKSSTASSSSLPDNEKFEATPLTPPIPIYDRLADEANHYHVKAKVGGELKSIYVYNLHAGIELVNEDLEDDAAIAPDKAIAKIAESVDPSPAVVKSSIDIKDKKAIQNELIRVGLLDGQKGAADGKWGSLSESAWRAWCRFANIGDFSISQEAVELLLERVGYKELDLRPKDPNNKECIIATLCLKRMQELGMWLAVSMGSDSPAWNFWYLSGTNADGTFNKDSIDNMNDLRFLAQIGSDGRVSVGGCWVATWDAGWKYRKNRMNPAGCFQVDYNQQFFAWVRGKHGAAAPHYALIQVGEITGTRDNSENGRTSDDKAVRGSGFGVNHHGTPGRSAGSPIGFWSAGCGVGDNYSSHQKFMSIIDLDRRFKASSGHLVSSCFLDRSKVKGLPLR